MAGVPALSAGGPDSSVVGVPALSAGPSQLSDWSAHFVSWRPSQISGWSVSLDKLVVGMPAITAQCSWNYSHDEERERKREGG